VDLFGLVDELFDLLWPSSPTFLWHNSLICSPCQLTILTSWTIIINPYDSSNRYHPWREGYQLLSTHEPPGPFCSWPDHSGSQNHGLVLVLKKTKLHVSSDGLTSSSKLQTCPQLCRFTQALLKTNVARWKVHFLIDN
jgi:hypothetical protein